MKCGLCQMETYEHKCIPCWTQGQGAVTCYLPCLISHTLSSPLISLMGLYRTELFTLYPTSSPEGPVGTLFLWLSPFQLTCLALKSYSAFSKGKIHVILMGKNLITVAGAHLHHFWDKKVQHTQKFKHFREKVPGTNFESSFQAPADITLAFTGTCHLSFLS